MKLVGRPYGGAFLYYLNRHSFFSLSQVNSLRETKFLTALRIVTTFTCFSFKVLHCGVLAKTAHIINDSINFSFEISHIITTKNILIECLFGV